MTATSQKYATSADAVFAKVLSFSKPEITK